MFRSIQITMDETPNGERFDQFFSEIPYTIFGAAWIDDHSQHTRWHCPNVRIQAVPFSVLVRTLQLHLDHFHSYLSGISEDYIRACACTSPLSALPT